MRGHDVVEPSVKLYITVKNVVAQVIVAARRPRLEVIVVLPNSKVIVIVVFLRPSYSGRTILSGCVDCVSFAIHAVATSLATPCAEIPEFTKIPVRVASLFSQQFVSNARANSGCCV